MSPKQWVWYNKDMYRQMTMSVPSDELGRVRKKKKILAPIERIVLRKKWVPLIHVAPHLFHILKKVCHFRMSMMAIQNGS